MAATLESTGAAPPENLKILGQPREAEQLQLELAPALVDLRDLNLVLTFTCATVLFDGAAVAPYKDSDHELLTSSTVFFALMSYAIYLASGARDGDRSELEELTTLRAWGDYLRQDEDLVSRMNELIDDTFDEPPQVSHLILRQPAHFASLSTRIAPDLRHVFERLDGRHPTGAHTLGRALLATPGDQLAARIKRFGLEPLVKLILTPEPSDAPPPAPPRAAAHPRRSTRIAREAQGDELGLGIEHYARALATIMRTAEGEFAFALLGPWGSGKTTLARQTAPLLQSSAAFRKGQSFLPDDALANREYAVVWHSAWKYRRTPEAWIFLYKSLADHAMKTSSMLGSLAIALRAATELHGRRPIFLALSAIALAGLPLLAKLHLAAALASLIGLTSVLYLLSVIGGTTHKVKALFSKHVRLSSHDDKLGMLALVGDDVRALLSAWIPETNVGPARERALAKNRVRRDAIFATVFVMAISVVWLSGLYLESRPLVDMTGASSKLRRALSDIARPACDAGIFEPTSVFCATSEAGNKLPTSDRGAVSLLHIFFFVLWFSLAMVLLLLPILHRHGLPDRIMLIVDDLDRCNPDEMLEIIEALKLLLEEPFVQQRLQALMLVDEDVLEHAIAQRFSRLIKERREIIARAGGAPGAIASARRQVLAEHIEKLFACHLRVARLDKDEIAEAVELHAGKELRAQLREGLSKGEANSREGEALTKDNEKIRKEIKHFPKSLAVFGALQESKMLEGQKKIDDRQAALASTMEQARRELSPPHMPDVSFSDSDLRFQREEIDVIKALVPGYFDATHRRPSQRSIKALLFKIQLCHLLLHLRAGDTPPSKIAIASIVNALSGKDARDDGELEQVVRLVAAQVA
jgi:hypothetical protein